jgi:hypothetical protein
VQIPVGAAGRPFLSVRGVAEDVLGREGPAPAVGPSEDGQQPGVREGAEAALHGAVGAAQVRRQLPDGHDAGLAVGHAGTALLGGADRQDGVEVDGPGVPAQAAERGAGDEAEQAEAVGAGRDGRGEGGAVEHRGPPGGCMGMPGSC